MRTQADRVLRVVQEAGVPERKIRSTLAAICGISYQSVKGWFEGGAKTIRADNLAAIASHYKVNLNWLATGKGHMHFQPNVERSPYSLSTNNGPVISWVLAGQWSEVMDLYAPGCAEEWEPLPPSAGEHSFWLRVVGDSMTAPHGGLSVPEGMLILVDPDYEAMPGKLVVAKLISSQEATFKKLVQDSGRLYLAPLNPIYPMMEVTEDVQIIGAVREYRCKL